MAALFLCLLALSALYVLVVVCAKIDNWLTPKPELIKDNISTKVQFNNSEVMIFDSGYFMITGDSWYDINQCINNAKERELL